MGDKKNSSFIRLVRDIIKWWKFINNMEFKNFCHAFPFLILRPCFTRKLTIVGRKKFVGNELDLSIDFLCHVSFLISYEH